MRRNRGGRVGEDRIRGDRTPVDGALPEAVIVDLDGTLADVGPVRHLVQPGSGRRRDFDAFHRYGSTSAEPIPDVVASVLAHHAAGRAVLLVSGRHECWREPTTVWLARNQVPFTAMFLRPNGDYRPDVQLKAGIYRNQIRQRYQVVMAYDDRPRVVELWRSFGIPVTLVPGWQETRGTGGGQPVP